jgi:hypothetical protein
MQKFWWRQVVVVVEDIDEDMLSVLKGSNMARGG